MGTRGKSVSFENRLQIVEAVLLHGLAVGDVANAHGISRKTVWQFTSSYSRDGPEGLRERSRAPLTSPQRKPKSVKRKVMTLRKKGWGAVRIGAELGVSGSTVHAILCSKGRNDLRPPKQEYPRFEMDFPGELLHIDIKELVPLGPGRPKQHLYAALDGFCREGFIQTHARGDGRSSAEFLEYVLSTIPYPIKAVMTDNGLNFSMRRSAHPERKCDFQRILEERQIVHKLTRPYTPRTNGKVERFFGTVGQELLRRVRFRGDEHRAEKLLEFVDYYNNSRKHSAIGYRSPTPYRVDYFASNH